MLFFQRFIQRPPFRQNFLQQFSASKYRLPQHNTDMDGEHLKEQVTLRTIMEKTQGLITIKPKVKITDSYTLSLVYTPGVGQCCTNIQNDPDLIYDYTITVNSMAVITDGSNQQIESPYEIIPRLEGQSAMFKLFYNIDVFPFILDTAVCKTAEDMVQVIENLSPVYKVIDLKHISEQRMKEILPLLLEKNLGVTVLYKDLWTGMFHHDEQGKIPVKDYMNSLIVEAAIVRALLDQRAQIAVGSEQLTGLIEHAWMNGKQLLDEIPNKITDLLIQTYVGALDYLVCQKLHHKSVEKIPAQAFIDRIVGFYFFGKKAFVKQWGKEHRLHETEIEENSIALHKRYQGMLAIQTKFKPRSLEEAYNIFFRSFTSDDIKQVEEKIRKDPSYADEVTFKSNLMAIITNGTAILGLGDIGAAAGLPVMEGKSVLFKSLAGIDVVPICIKEKNPKEVIKVVKMLAPIFTAINLEDIKAPECFEIENKLVEDLKIPIMHDDQHGTAVVCLAAIINGLKLMKKEPNEVKLVINGAGAAGLAICELLLGIGLSNIIICDTVGAIYEGRPKNMNEFKNKLAAITNREKIAGTLSDIIKGSDLFIGVSVAGALKPEYVKSMNPNPFILALANPVPEIMPEVAKQAGAFIVATGRSDFKNQVNNSLAFPGIFRGAIDTQARRINTDMKLAAAYAIANLVSPRDLCPEFIIPDALDCNIPSAVASAVTKAAIQSGVAQAKNVTPSSVQDFTRKLNIEGIIPNHSNIL